MPEPAAAALDPSPQTRGDAARLATSCGPVRDVQNFGTYLAQGAAESRPCPVSTGHVAVIDHMLRTRIAAVDGQVRVRMRTSTSGWATMQRVPGRCSSVGRAAVL